MSILPQQVNATLPPLGLGQLDVGHERIEIVDASRNSRPLPIDIWYPAEQSPNAGDLTAYDFARN
ncbi:MAG: hypothetical protein R3C28_06990 [Pirellulaceae bacterium]